MYALNMTNKEFHGQITSDMFYWLTIILSHGTFVYANKKRKINIYNKEMHSKTAMPC